MPDPRCTEFECLLLLSQSGRLEAVLRAVEGPFLHAGDIGSKDASRRLPPRCLQAGSETDVSGRMTRRGGIRL